MFEFFIGYLVGSSSSSSSNREERDSSYGGTSNSSGFGVLFFLIYSILCYLYINTYFWDFFNAFAKIFFDYHIDFNQKSLGDIGLGSSFFRMCVMQVAPVVIMLQAAMMASLTTKIIYSHSYQEYEEISIMKRIKIVSTFLLGMCINLIISLFILYMILKATF